MRTFEVDVNAVKNGGRTRSWFYTLQKEGTYVLRVLPPYSEAGVWFKQFRQYFFEVAGQPKTLIAPYGLTTAEDPIFAKRRELAKLEDKANDELVRKLTSSTRFLMNVVVISGPDGRSIKDGVTVISLPKRVKDQLVQFDTDPSAGYTNITSLDKGFNVVIKKEGSGITTTYSVMPQRQSSDLAAVAAAAGVDISNWELVNLDEQLTPASTEELQAVLDYVVPAAQVLNTDKGNDFNSWKSRTSNVENNATTSVTLNTASASEDMELLNQIAPPKF